MLGIFKILIIASLLINKSISQTCSSSVDLTQVPGECNKFYRCANGILSVNLCPSGLNFDNNYKVCNWPNQVTCVSGGTSTGGSSGGSTGGSGTGSGSTANLVVGSACSLAVDLTQVPGDCTKFYRCGSGILSIFSCPSGLYFDNNLKICNWPNQVTCSSGGYVPPVTLAPTVPIITTPNPNSCSSVTISNFPGDCTRYYECFNDIAILKTCPTGTLYDTITKNCMPSMLVTGKCNNFPNCILKGISSTQRINMCSLASFRADYPDCC